MKRVWLLTLALVWSGFAAGAEFDAVIPMWTKGAATYYVGGEIEGLGPVEFMVDTGSGYLAIGQKTLEALQAKGEARYVRDLTGVMADGSHRVVPVYRLSKVVIGRSCVLYDVEAAVFPGLSRNILGLSALKQASPFVFSVEPPRLVLSHCGDVQV